ncbi:MAG: hypothetical protein KF735_18250 [Chelatococcus sp.]|uniref:hypothetical protein n=1 Tax=Chelatococcus sp. TaxID=1953771 RepID=UPI0025C6A972|nr:hypothetical protein [Chelatococcus sp.]MBX3539588.1 hypothetical protein [Chelatococcus sp.]
MVDLLSVGTMSPRGFRTSVSSFASVGGYAGVPTVEQIEAGDLLSAVLIAPDYGYRRKRKRKYIHPAG